MTSLSQRGISRVWNVTHRSPGGPHKRQGFVLEPGHWQEFDPFLLMAEDWFQTGTFGDHPHRGMETVTVVLDGHLQHRDSHGGSGLLGPGDVQWMTAGRGVVHAEEPVPGETVHSLQLWLNLSRAQKTAEPRYQDLSGDRLPVRREEGAVVRVISGASGDVTADTLNHTPVTAVEFVLAAGAAVTQGLPGSYNGFIYVLEGSGQFGVDGTSGQQGQVLWLGPADGGADSEVSVRAERALRAVLFAGEPIREPVVAHGPFVMNSEQEIRQAFADYQAGKF
ncbi:MAG: pirin [Firmicutes bacterium]|nr:pirin [Bacillota bacterium]